MKLAEKLQLMRKREGLSQEDLAEKLGISRQAVSKWESGQSVPDLNKLIILSELYKVTIDYLVK
ncbi:helix-turn-helix transcriptional regulator [Clostridium perfringens]|nr:helix-turn-helix transcriptional regulator [Clostridium perfringens]